MKVEEKLSRILKKTFMPPDSNDICWVNGNDNFTREEVAFLLWTQIAMIGNDLKHFCGNDLTSEIYEVLDNPRIPRF